ncbi:hypothetical protein ACJX0J_000252, partial (mitochondrion) [Zea mays]
LSLFYFRVFFLMEVPGDYERKKHHFSTLDEKKIKGGPPSKPNEEMGHTQWARTGLIGNHLEKTSNWEGDPPGELTNGIVDLVTFVWYFSVLFFVERDKEKMTFASECYKLVVVIALLRISIWEVVNCGYIFIFFIAVAQFAFQIESFHDWDIAEIQPKLFLPIWDTPPSHDNHSASTKDGFSIDFRTYRDLLFH